MQRLKPLTPTPMPQSPLRGIGGHQGHCALGTFEGTAQSLNFDSALWNTKELSGERTL